MRREVSVVNKKVCSFPILFALLALLIGTCAVVFPASAQAAPTSTGSITVSGTVARSYDAYQIFDANVIDGDNDAKIATDLAWASDAVRDAVLPVLHSAGMPNSQTTAQEAAEWLNTDSHLTSALSAQLARSLQSSGAEPVALNAGTTAELSCGYWLIVADDDAISQNEAGTAPIMALVGGSAVTVKPKAATPKVSKYVLEDGTAAWQKAADATVGDDLYWRLSATVPVGLTAYDTYTVQFVDTMSAGLDLSKVAASMRVCVAAGADGGFDAVSAGKDGRAGTESAKGWTDITAQCRVSVDGKTFTVRTGERTFEAAAFLRRAGADTSEMKKLLQTDMEHTVARYKILQTASIYRADIAIAAPTEPQERIVAAQAADELLNIAGVTASLVIYPMGNGDVFISARSIGELNVQLVMEALGGGGSRSSAAVQLHDVSVAQAVQMARAAIDDNLEN